MTGEFLNDAFGCGRCVFSKFPSQPASVAVFLWTWGGREGNTASQKTMVFCISQSHTRRKIPIR